MKGAWMQWSAEIEREGLKRIVALLFALADLADRAGGASRSVRRTVLDILWPAEAVAREFVMGFPLGFDPAACASEAAGMDSAAILWDDRAEAVRLASSFRALALLLAYLLTGMRNPRRARCVLCPDTVLTIAVLTIMGAPGVRRPDRRARGPPQNT
jgi:hypothetical protein